MANKNTTKKIAVGAAVAAAAGFVAGVLTAPKSGKETRQDLKKVADKGASALDKELKQLHGQMDELVAQAKTKAGDVTDSAKKELDDLLSRTESSRQKVQDLAKNLKPGSKADKELKKAMDDANKAIDHLKNYLKK